MEQNQSNYVCVSCGQSFSGKYCNHCGEKVLEPHERTFLYFVSQLINELTSVESKLWSTLKAIVVAPGKLSSDMTNGRRVVYMRPLALFLLGNVIYFMFPVMDTFNTKLKYQLLSPYNEIAQIQSRIDRIIDEKEFSYEVFETVYNEKSEANSKLLLILLIPLFAPVFAAVGWWRRKRISDHLWFSLEYNIFMLYISILGFGYLFLAYRVLLSITGIDPLPLSEFTLSSIVSGIALYFLTRGIKRFYGYSLPTALILGLGMIASTLMVLFLYRWILLEVTLLGF